MSDGYRPINELRWLKRDGGPKPPVLQQKWEKYIPNKYATYHEKEWRDVPTVQEPEHE